MKADRYAESRLQRLLAEDERVSELGIRVVRLEEGAYALCGEVESAQRRETIEQVVAEAFPDLRIQTDIGVTRVHEPDDFEDV